jgi:hypothetical protein
MKNTFIRTFVLVFPFIAISIIIFISCQHDTIKKDELRKIYFDTEVLPIFLNNCTASECHSGSGRVFALTNYHEIVKDVTKGNPGSSRLYQAITSTLGNTMPPNRPLDIQQRTFIYLWIEQGAENNKDTSKIVVAKKN